MSSFTAAEARAAYSALETLARHRGWHVYPDAARITPRRRDFRFLASGGSSPQTPAPVYALALFVDFRHNARAADDTDDPPPTDPSVDAVRRAMSRASAEVRARFVDGDTRTLVLLALSAAPRVVMPAPVRAFFGAFTLDAATAGICFPEPWHVADLAIDVLGHSLVSPHRRATLEECALYPAHQLPTLPRSDPVARWHGFREHEIIAEVRDDDPDIGANIYLWRVVVDTASE